MGRENYFESMIGGNGRMRRDLAEDNDEIIFKNSAFERFYIPEMTEILERAIREVKRKQTYKDLVGRDIPNQLRIVGGENAGRGVSLFSVFKTLPDYDFRLLHIKSQSDTLIQAWDSQSFVVAQS